MMVTTILFKGGGWVISRFKKELASWDTLSTAKIISGKNARAWVSLVSYLKK